MNQCEKNYRMKIMLDSVTLEKPPVWGRQNSCHTLLQPLGVRTGPEMSGRASQKRGQFVLCLEG